MKIRILIVSILAVLALSAISPAQDVVAPEQEPSFEAQVGPAAPPPGRPAFPGSPRPAAKPMARPARVRPTTAAESPNKLTIFELKYAEADELANMISRLFNTEVHIDYRLNRLIVNATEEQIKGVASLVEAMDIPDSEASTPREIQTYVYRVYMFEVPSGNQNMRSFSLILQTPAQVSSKELPVAAADVDLQISELLQINDGPSEPQVEILIRGKAASDESFKRFFEKFPESYITELKWDDNETFTNNIAAAQYTQLPEQMQKHVRRFLGDDIRTVGYWFGNLSVPGEVEAPIGPWKLNLQLDTASDRMLELDVDVKASDEMHSFDGRLGRKRNDEIFSNTIRAKIGKPIIIGYNRESYGTRRMGAMVIVPEEDSLGSDTAEGKLF
jgi:hypothetical protein